MSFREEDSTYKQLVAAWWETIEKAHHPGLGILIDEVDNLMLASFRLQRCIKTYLRGTSVDVKYNYVPVPLLPDALKAARKKLSAVKNGVSSLYSEAEVLESLSRAAYQWLKDNDKLAPTLDEFGNP